MAASTLAFSVSAGSDRLLVVQVSAESDPGASDDDVLSVDYGGQAMVKVRYDLAFTTGNSAGTSFWYLLDAGIVAAVGTTITPTFANPGNVSDPMIHAASYEGARQDAGVLVEHQGDNVVGASPDPITTIDLVESSGNLLVAGGAIGEPLPEGTVSSWSAAMTEQTDQLSGSAASSFADRLSTTEANQDIELNWVGPVNRQTANSVHFAQVGFEPSCLREASATDSPTSTSTTYEVIPGMTLTPGGGDYLAWFSASINGDGSLPGDIFIALFVNGVIVPHTERQLHFDSSWDAGVFMFSGTHALVQPTDGQVVDVRWFASSLTTMTVLQRTLNLIKLDAADVDEVTATADDTTLSTSYTAMDSMQITPGAGKFALFFTTTIEGDGTDDDVRCAVFVDGVIVQHTERSWVQESSIVGSSLCYAIAAEVNPTAGQVVEIQWFTAGGLATVHERTLTLWKTEQIQEVSATADTTTTSTTFGLLDSMTLTPDADEYLAMFTGYWEGSAVMDLEGIIVEGGVEVPHTQRESGIDSSVPATDHCVGSNGIVNVDGAETVQVHWRRSTGGTATCHERTLVLISCLALVEKVATDDIDLEINEGVTDLLSLAEVLDTLGLEVNEGAGQVSAGITASDLLDLEINEGVALLLGLINPQDTLDLEVNEDGPQIDVEGTAQDNLDIDLVEAAELLAQAEVNDSLDLEVNEDTGQVAIMVDAQDTLDLDLAELAVLLSLSTVQDTLDLDLIEVTEVESQAGVQDTLDVALDEVSQVNVPIDVNDLLDLEIVEDTPQITVALTALDTLDLEILEDPAIVDIIGAILKEATDTLDLAILEGPAQVAVGIIALDDLDLSIEEGVTLLLGFISPQDLLDLAILEGDPAISVEGTATDDLDLEVNEETANLLALVEVLDNLDLEILEDPAVVDVIGVVLKIASDLLDLEINEGVSQVAAGITDEDTLSLEVNEDTGNLLGLIQPEDTAGVSLDELTEILARAERLDTLDLDLTEAADLLALLTRSDTLDLEILEDAGQIAVGISAADNLDLEILEGLGQVVVGIQANDTLNLVLIEATTLLGFINRSDTLDIGIVEGVPLVFVRVDVDDILDLALDPEVSDLVILAQVDIDAADTLDLAIVEGVGQVTVAIQATDLLDLSVSEVAQVVGFLNRQDILDLDLGEQADVAVFIQAADQLDIEILDVSGLVIALQAADDLDIDLVEFSQVFNALSVIDTLDLDLTEDAFLQAITLDFEGIITKVITLETLKNCPIRLEVTRSVRFTLEIDPGVQRP